MVRMQRKTKPLSEETQYYLLTRKFWAIFAPLYDLAVKLLFKLRDRVVKLSQVKYGSVILDMATGTGQQAFAFARRGYKVVGIDISDSMLRVANRNNKYANVRFQLADATNLPLENDSFDVVTISFAIHDMPASVQERVLKEMFRVVKPEGVFLIVDYSLPRNRIARLLIYQFVKSYEGVYYVNFIKSNMRQLIKHAGINRIQAFPCMLGAVSIWKGSKNVHGTAGNKIS